VLGGTPDKRILRGNAHIRLKKELWIAVGTGGSFVDSVDGKFNHVVMVSTKQTNAGDSGADNIGFR
jgi:hypothetical protein